ncbi:MAG: NCS2 family permease [Bacilli bacterium]
MLNKMFHLQAHHTSVRTEVIAGFTSFLTVMYIVITNASILKDAGMNEQAAMVATILVSTASTLLIAFWANAPLVIVPGMGINALFSYTLVHGLGLSWQTALTAVALSGVVVSILAFSGLSKRIQAGIPDVLKQAITVGVGFLILFIGLQKAQFVVPNEQTFVALAPLNEWPVAISIGTFLLIIILHHRGVKTSILISLVLGTLISMFVGASPWPTFTENGFELGSISATAFQLSFTELASLPVWIGVFSITIVVVFENMGLLHGQLSMAKGEEKFDRAFQAMGISNILCGLVGTSPTISAAESFSGIAAGGRTGLTALVAGVSLLCSLLLLPLMSAVPNAVIGAILIYIGCLMIMEVKHMRAYEFQNAVPAIIIIAVIPLTFSIVDGIAFGFLAYTILHLFAKAGGKLSMAMKVVSFFLFVYVMFETFMFTGH